MPSSSSSSNQGSTTHPQSQAQKSNNNSNSNSNQGLHSAAAANFQLDPDEELIMFEFPEFLETEFRPESLEILKRRAPGAAGTAAGSGTQISSSSKSSATDSKQIDYLLLDGQLEMEAFETEGTIPGSLMCFVTEDTATKGPQPTLLSDLNSSNSSPTNALNRKGSNNYGNGLSYGSGNHPSAVLPDPSTIIPQDEIHPHTVSHRVFQRLPGRGFLPHIAKGVEERARRENFNQEGNSSSTGNAGNQNLNQHNSGTRDAVTTYTKMVDRVIKVKSSRYNPAKDESIRHGFDSY